MSLDTELLRFFRDLEAEVKRASETKPEEILVQGTKHGVSWEHDDDVDEDYALVGFTLPYPYIDHIFPSVQQDTYGYLEGFRVYYTAY